MDHISFQKGVDVSTREKVSSMRVFDGEDQGKSTFSNMILGLGNRQRM